MAKQASQAQFNMKDKRVPDDKSGILIQFIAVLVCASLHFYWTWPAYALNLFYVETNARVTNSNQEKFRFEFFSKYENKNVSFTRELLGAEKPAPKNQVFRVRYSKFLPDEVVILGADKIPDIWLPAIVHLIFLCTIGATGRALIRQIRFST